MFYAFCGMRVKASVTSRRQENTQATRTALLDAAKRLFAKQGFVATSIDDVAEAARVTKGAVYHHFRDKSELFEAVFRAEQTRVLTRVMAAAPASKSPWDQLLARIDAYIDCFIANNDHRALLLQANVALGSDRCRAIDESLALPAMKIGLEKLMAQGAIKQLPVEMLARVLFSALCEAAMTAAVQGKEASRKEASQVLRSIVDGLRRAPPRKLG
jgi:AcrR family transcriptional regulator